MSRITETLNDFNNTHKDQVRKNNDSSKEP